MRNAIVAAMIFMKNRIGVPHAPSMDAYVLDCTWFLYPSRRFFACSSFYATNNITDSAGIRGQQQHNDTWYMLKACGAYCSSICCRASFRRFGVQL